MVYLYFSASYDVSYHIPFPPVVFLQRSPPHKYERTKIPQGLTCALTLCQNLFVKVLTLRPDLDNTDSVLLYRIGLSEYPHEPTLLFPFQITAENITLFLIFTQYSFQLLIHNKNKKRSF